MCYCEMDRKYRQNILFDWIKKLIDEKDMKDKTFWSEEKEMIEWEDYDY